MADYDPYSVEPPQDMSPPGQDMLRKLRAAALQSKQKLTPEQANQLAQMSSGMPGLADLQHRIAMAHALNMKGDEPGSGTIFGVLAKGINAKKESNLQDQYSQQLEANRGTQEDYLLAILRAMGITPPSNESGTQDAAAGGIAPVAE